MATSFESFVFLDLESTGLPHCELDGKRTRITEICMISVTKEHLLKCCERNAYIPRVSHKIVLPINPRKVISVDATNLSGLDNFMLENEEPFGGKVTALIGSFLNACKPPFCLIAHNGYLFDFPLLREELKKFGDAVIASDARCSDSKVAFRELSKMRESQKIEKQIFLHEIRDTLSRADLDAACGEHERSSIRLDPEVTEIDLAFNEVAREIELQHSPLKKNGECKATEVIQRINETTPKSQPLTSTVCVSAGGERRRLFDSQAREKNSSRLKEGFRLMDVYWRLFGENIVNQHEAEGDVIALIKCCAKYGQPIVDWFEEHNKNFCEIKPMYG